MAIRLMIDGNGGQGAIGHGIHVGD